MKKRASMLLLTVVMVLSVLISVAVPSFAAGTQQVANTPIHLCFVDGDTGEAVPVDFSAQYQKGWVYSYTTDFSVIGQSSYTWTPSNPAKLQRIQINGVPGAYELTKTAYSFSYANGYPAKSEECSTVQINASGLIQIALYKKSSPENIRVELRSRITGRILAGESLIWGVKGQQNNLGVDSLSAVDFHPMTEGEYTVLAYTYSFENANIDTKFEYDGEQVFLSANNTYEYAAASDHTVTIFIDPIKEEQLSPYIDVHFIDAQTKDPIKVQWSFYKEDAPQKNWEVQHRVASDLGVLPNTGDGFYILVLENVPDGYAMPEETALSFEVFENSIHYGMNTPPNMSLDFEKAAITVALDREVPPDPPVNPDPEPIVNLLKNPDFETIGHANWYYRGSNPTVMQTNTEFNSGVYSLYMAYFKNEGFNNHIDQTCAVNASGNYNFSAYIKTDAMLTGAGAMLMLEARDGDGILLASGSSPALANSNSEWRNLEMQMYAPPGTATIVAKIGGVYCTGGFYLDAAGLYLIP